MCLDLHICASVSPVQIGDGKMYRPCQRPCVLYVKMLVPLIAGVPQLVPQTQWEKAVEPKFLRLCHSLNHHFTHRGWGRTVVPCEKWLVVPALMKKQRTAE